MIYIISILINPVGKSFFPVDGGGVFLEEATPIIIEMFHNRRKMAKFVLDGK